MERTIVVNWSVFCACLLLFQFISATLHQQDVSNQQDRELSESDLWLNPGLLRKKKNSKNNDLDETSPNSVASFIEFVIKPWNTVLDKNEIKRHPVSYTPRLGRESGEQLLDGNEERWLQDNIRPEELSQRSPPFAPRLGRNMSPFYPRLGREVDRLAVF